MDPLDRPLGHLFAHHLDITASCKCTKVTVFSPESLVWKLGVKATLRIAAARLKCRTCGERPTLTIARDYPTSEGRDTRRDPPPLPEWVVPLLKG